MFLMRIMQGTLHGYNISISVGGRTVHNVCFEDFVELMGDSNNELHDKTNIYKRTVTYGMELVSVKSKVLLNSISNSIG